MTPELAAKFTGIALECIHREEPHYFSRLRALPGGESTPRAKDVTPAFYGCYDWHSAVHTHWALIRMLRCCPGQSWETQVRQTLSLSLTDANLQTELEFFSQPANATFEYPYGWAWLLQLYAELISWEDADAEKWRRPLEELQRLLAEQMLRQIEVLPSPVQSGQHDQTAFALGLTWDWAQTVQATGSVERLAQRIRDLFEHLPPASLSSEPGQYDFLSPSLAVADLMRRVMFPDEFSHWLSLYLPEIPTKPDDWWLVDVVCPDPSDGKLSHLEGLNLSRAWMLQGIASHLAEGDPRRAGLLHTAKIHEVGGIPSVTGEHYSGAHWLGSFAVYLLTQRGITPQA